MKEDIWTYAISGILTNKTIAPHARKDSFITLSMSHFKDLFSSSSIVWPKPAGKKHRYPYPVQRTPTPTPTTPNRARHLHLVDSAVTLYPNLPYDNILLFLLRNNAEMRRGVARLCHA
jgi:hypothetical protein